jgi:D-alanine-D-alanine ligase
VLHGEVAPEAPPDEQDVLAEVDAVCAALVRLGYEPVPLALDLDLSAAARALSDLRPALVFNLVESVGGRGQLIHLGSALLELIDLPFTGAGTAAMVATSNKVLAKRLMRAAGIPTPTWVEWPEAARGALPAVPCIVKSVWEHASIGLSEASVVPPQRLATVLAEHREVCGGEWFAEEYVEGREFNVALVEDEDGPAVFPVAEIRFLDYPAGKPRIVDYRAKWQADSFEYRHTVRSFGLERDEPDLAVRLTDLARQCWTLFGLNGYARVDFRVDVDRAAWVLEVNANPCLAPDAGFAAAAVQGGWSLDRLVDSLAARALAGRMPAAPAVRPAVG